MYISCIMAPGCCHLEHGWYHQACMTPDLWSTQALSSPSLIQGEYAEEVRRQECLGQRDTHSTDSQALNYQLYCKAQTDLGSHLL
jgi:hypothetical protein